MRRSLAILGLAAALPSAAHAQTALTVDFDALHRVDLRTHETELIAELGTGDARFACGSLTVSEAGEIRCVGAADAVLYAIDPDGVATALAPLPDGTDAYSGLAFDGLGRLWYVRRQSATLWQLDPASGAVVGAQALSLTGGGPRALAAYGERLFVFTESDSSNESWLEEIDVETGGSLSALPLRPSIDLNPLDAAFDAHGDLWVSSWDGEIVLGANVYSYRRIQLSPFSIDETWSGVIAVFFDPRFVNLAGVVAPGTLADVPALDGVGIALLALCLASAGWLALRRGGL